MMRQSAVGVLLVTALAIVAAYANALDATFQLDDQTSIVANPAVRALDPGAWWEFWPTRVVAYGSFALSQSLHGLEPGGLRLDNLVVHVAATWVVYALVSLLLQLRGYRNSPRLVSAAAALVFALHPLQTQAVTYVVQRTAALCALFYLGAVAVWLIGLRRRRQGRRCRWCLPVVLALGLAANLTKELAITLPLALLLADRVAAPEQGGRLRRWLPTVILVLVVPLAASRGRFGVGEASLGAETTDVSHWRYWITQWEVIARYLQLLVWPPAQNVDHHVPFRGLAEGWPWLGVHLATLGLAGLAWRRGRLLVAFAIAWLYLTLLPESSLFPIRDAMFEHRMYLPLLGPALLLGLGLGALHRRSGAAALSLLVVIALGLGSATHLRNRVWATPLTLWTDSVSKSPLKSRPHMALGQALGAEGRTGVAGEHLQRAVALDPTSYRAWTNLGNVHLMQGNPVAAEDAYRRALSLKPDHTTARFNLAIVLEQARRNPEAEQAYRRVIAEDPGHARAMNALASLLLRRGKLEEAERLARRAAAAGQGAPRLLEAIARARRP